MPHLRVYSQILQTLLLILLAIDIYGAEKVLVNEEITTRINAHHGPLISDSDSLFLNQKKLNKDIDYTVDYSSGIFNLKNFQPSVADTLKIFYAPLPNWLRQRYGIVAESAPRSKENQNKDFKSVKPIINSPVSSRLQVNGAKKFSVFSETTGSSRFDQSLELTINGELTPGLQISGSVSDREYYSSSGSINSTISELDKINLKIKSKHLQAEIGDLEIYQLSGYGQPNIKQVSGLEVSFQNSKTSILATVARPRGRLETLSFNGSDLIQGPYRLFARGSINNIVPGSEKVWLNGRLLEKGADKDFTIDYSLATITFSPKVPVDSRSRIEVDFEPLSENYQKEYYRLQTGLALADSVYSFEFGYLHEGDNKNRLKIGQLSPADKLTLESIGDSTELAWSDGATADTSGSYVERFDSNGNRYFEYIGENLGDYSVLFSSVGNGLGEYQYIGSGVYQYVGAGFGEYLPQVPIPVPASEDYFNAGLIFKPIQNGMVSLKMQQSIYDQNLFSKLDDKNKAGGNYSFTALYGAAPGLKSKKTGGAVTVDFTGKKFKNISRQNHPDLGRIFLLPDSLDRTKDKVEIRAASSIILPTPYSLLFSGGLLDYKNKFNSGYGEIAIFPNNEKMILPTLSYRRLRAGLDSLGTEYHGRSDLFAADWNYSAGNTLDIQAGIKHNRRTNRYNVNKQGTTERDYNFGLKYKTVELKYEKYNEDTLITSWQNQLKRDRIILVYGGKITGIKTDLYLTTQRLKQNQLTQNQLMARIKYSYSPSGRNYSIGGSYSLSDENRYERGLRYIEVEPGFGKFIFEDSQYIPDPNGNYIEIEEILSNQAAVKKGERSFNLFYNPDNLYLRFGSNITEELLSDGQRTALWIVPFLSDSKESYLYRRLYYTSDIKLVRSSGFYIINLSGSYNFESRRVGGVDFEKYEQVLKTTIRQKSGSWYFSQEGSYFKYQRDSYYLSAGNIDGYKISVSTIKNIANSQISGELSFRSAEDDNGSQSKQYSAKIAPALRFANRGETVVSIMGYFQELTGGNFSSYRLTENLSGKKGGVWSIRSEYRVGRDIKFVLSFGGRFSDQRKPRNTGRGELIASF